MSDSVLRQHLNITSLRRSRLIFGERALCSLDCMASSVNAAIEFRHQHPAAVLSPLLMTAKCGQVQFDAGRHATKGVFVTTRETLCSVQWRNCDWLQSGALTGIGVDVTWCSEDSTRTSDGPEAGTQVAEFSFECNPRSSNIL